MGKQITSYLDSRYSDDGTEITSDELSEVAGKPESAFASIAAEPRKFTYTRRKKDTTSIQFNVRVGDIQKIKDYLGRRSMSNGEVGRHVFDYFLENVVT